MSNGRKPGYGAVHESGMLHFERMAALKSRASELSRTLNFCRERRDFYGRSFAFLKADFSCGTENRKVGSLPPCGSAESYADSRLLERQVPVSLHSEFAPAEKVCKPPIMTLSIICHATTETLVEATWQRRRFDVRSFSSNATLIEVFSCTFGKQFSISGLQANHQIGAVIRSGEYRPERMHSGLLTTTPVLSPSRITLENNGKIRPQPDRENSFTWASGGARRRFKTRIGLLAQPNFTPPISGAKVLADASISVSAA